MAEFNKDIGGIGFTSIPSSAQVTNVSDTADAELLLNLANEGIGAFKGYEVNKLLGNSNSKVPSQRVQVPDVVSFGQESGVLPIVQRTKEVEMFDPEGILNFNQLRVAREQGKLDDIEAAVRARTITANAISRFPGLAPEFKKAYSDFFGEVGPGRNTLTPDAATAVQRKAAEAVAIEQAKLQELEGIRSGIATREQVRKDSINEKLEAQKYFGGSVEALRRHQVLTKSNEFKLLDLKVQNEQNMLGSRQWGLAAADIGNQAAADFMGLALTRLQELGGAFPSNDKRQLLLDLKKTKQEFTSKLLSVAPAGADPRQLDVALKGFDDAEQAIIDNSLFTIDKETADQIKAATGAMTAKQQLVLTKVAAVYGSAAMREFKDNQLTYRELEGDNSDRAKAYRLQEGYKVYQAMQEQGVDIFDTTNIWLESTISGAMPPTYAERFMTLSNGKSFIEKNPVSTMSEKDKDFADKNIANLTQAPDEMWNTLITPNSVAILKDPKNIRSRRAYNYMYAATAAQLAQSPNIQNGMYQLKGNVLTFTAPAYLQNIGTTQGQGGSVNSKPVTYTIPIGMGMDENNIVDDQGRNVLIDDKIKQDIVWLNRLYKGAVTLPDLLENKGTPADTVMNYLNNASAYVKEAQQELLDTSTVGGNPQSSTGVSPKTVAKVQERFGNIISDAAQTHGVPEEILQRLVATESAGNPKAIGPATRFGKAKGLTQLLDSTASELGVTDPFDPEQAIEGGAKYLGQLLEKFGDIKLAVAAYHAGAASVSSWLDGEKGSGVGPKTIAYVEKVIGEPLGSPDDYV